MTEKDAFKTGGGLAELENVLAGVDDPLINQAFGNYRIQSLIAEGGMGRVYRGTRDDGQFDREVAIKILPPGMGQEYIRRFEQERKILASLSHPNIAQLHDAGLAKTGNLYLVMELIDGLPIDAYAAEHALDTIAKTRLLLSLSEVLAFAHAKLVVHRDLKPSNVFVTTAGDLKLLDFGIAKILEAPDSVTVESRPMTPRYASPEQLLNEPISVASDIYQLGLLFISLFPEREGVARETQASATERAVNKTSATVESRIAERLPVELNAIINKCLRAEPAERYASATDLAMDLRNFLGGFPVSARNPGAVQRAGKFLRRNWLPTSAITVAFLALLVLLIATLYQQQRTQEALLLAERQQQRAEKTTSFMVDLFNANRPSEALGEDLSAMDILQRGLDKLDALEDQPALKADLLDTIAGVYRNLGDYEKALELAQSSLGIKEAVYAKTSLEIAKTLDLVARLQMWFGDHAAALQTGRKIYELYLDQLGADDEQTLDALYIIGTAHGGLSQFDEAEQALSAVLDGQRRIHGENHPSVTTAINNLAVVYGDRGDNEKAVKLMVEVIRWNEVQLPPDHPWAAMDWYNYGGFLGRVGRYEEANDALLQSLRIREKVEGADHPLTGLSLLGLGHLAERRGRLDEAIKLKERALAIFSASETPPHPLLAASLVSVGLLKHALGETELAERYIIDSAEQYRALQGESPDAHISDFALARIRVDQGRANEALELLNPIVASEFKIPQLYGVLTLKARALRQLGRYSESESVIEETIRFLTVSLRPNHSLIAAALLEKARLFLATDRKVEALTIINDALVAYEQWFPYEHWEKALARALHAEARLAIGGDPTAAGDLEQAVQQLETVFPDTDPGIIRARRLLGAQ